MNFIDYNPPESDPVPAIADASFWDILKAEAAKAIDTGLSIWQKNTQPELSTPYQPVQPAPLVSSSGTVTLGGVSLSLPVLAIGGGLLYLVWRRKRK